MRIAETRSGVPVHLESDRTRRIRLLLFRLAENGLEVFLGRADGHDDSINGCFCDE